jgi:uncharacterized protein (DUF111 family)
MSTDEQTQIAYADCFSGVSGDMFLGALLDAGMPLDHLQSELAKLDLEEFTIQSFKQQDQNINSTRFVIESVKSETVRAWKDIRSLIEQSGLKNKVKKNLCKYLPASQKRKPKYMTVRSKISIFMKLEELTPSLIL